MSNLFGATKKGFLEASSLTESIFGPPAASKNIDLFTKPTLTPSTSCPRKHKRPRTRAPSGSESTPQEVEKGGGESREEKLHRRHRQSQDEALNQLTISLKDYRSGGDDTEELFADVRGLMKHHGLVILRDALSEQDVAKITNLADATQRRICETLDARKIPYNSPINNTKTICFQELAVRCQGRMDVRYVEDCDSDDATTCDNMKQQLPSLSLIDNLAASVLHGAEAPNLVYSGWIFSFPGSSDQPWHQDGSPLFEKGTESLPSYALNVFCGLHPAQLLELGPTEFVVGSHHMEPVDAMNKIDTAVSAVLGKGDILLYDYRICHRGTSNISSSSSVASSALGKEDENDSTDLVRKVLYLMYARPWFREHLNFGDKGLFE